MNSGSVVASYGELAIAGERRTAVPRGGGFGANSDARIARESLGPLRRRLIERIKELVRQQQQLTLVIVDHLREIEARSLHLTRGFGSLFDYAVTELGYTPSDAWRRIQAMHLSSQIDGVRERLEDGSLTVTAATQLQTAFDRNERQASVAAAVGAEAEAPPVLDVSARKALVEQAAGKSTREVERMLASVDPTLVPPREKVRRLADGKWELKAVIDDECERGLKELKRLLSHTNPSMTYGELVGRLVKEGLDRHDPGRRGSRRAGGSAPKSDEKPAANGASAAKSERTSAPNGTSPAESPTEPARAITSAPKERAIGPSIPLAIKRQVWKRDSRPLPLQRPGDRAALHLPASAADRSHPALRARRPRRPRQPAAALRSAPRAAHHRHRHAARASPGERRPFGERAPYGEWLAAGSPTRRTSTNRPAAADSFAASEV